MSDELERLESALRATSPRPSAAARERAISEAMAAFDRHRQGMSGEMRHKGQVPRSVTWWIRKLARKLAMPLSPHSLAFAGSAAVLMVAVVVSHRFVVTPDVAPSEVAGNGSENDARTFKKGLSLPLPEAATVEQPLAPAAGEAPESSPPPATASAPSPSGQGRAAGRPAHAGAPGVARSASVLTIDEGGRGTYTVRLESRPAGKVTVTPRSDTADVTLSPSSLTFDEVDWDVPQAVTVDAAKDDDAVDDTAVIAHEVSGYGALTDGGTVTVTVLDGSVVEQ